MAAISAKAPGKAILFGEHAVVYNRPAIAIPVTQVQVKTTITPILKGQPDEIWLESPEIGLKSRYQNLPSTLPLVQLIELVKNSLQLSHLPAMRISIHSSIPVAGGLGSGAAVSVSVIRALSAFLGVNLEPERICALSFEIEKRHHGTPSGIDNTVITYEKPIYFQRGMPIEFIKPSQPFHMVIADTGVKCPTSQAVAGVRQRWQAEPERYESLFDQVGNLTLHARERIESGQVKALGELMTANHTLLRRIGVSSPELDRLVDAALQAGAWGAKLSGGGQGGNIIALVGHDQMHSLSEALRQAGAVRTFQTHITP